MSTRIVMYVKVSDRGHTCDGNSGQWVTLGHIKHGYATPFVESTEARSFGDCAAKFVRVSFDKVRA